MQYSKFLLTVLQPLLANLDAQQDPLGNGALNETLTKLEKLDHRQIQIDRKLAAILETLSRDKGIVPPKFKRIGSRYFYIEHNARLDWLSAAEEELTIIRAKLRNVTHYWLGINDRNIKGTYVSFAKWATDEPRNHYGDVDCTVLYDKLMYQINCTQNHYNYICMADDKP
ncbi:hypothetical protein KR032_005875 [Drosophila birchii]|nr:hypothetical protein KR032_005875 [Drosophila birchii]